MTTSPTPPAPAGCQERGSVLLLTLVLTSMLALLATTFTASARNQMQLARDATAALRAELAAQSGLEYTRMQLTLDPTWEGTAGETLMLDGETGFSVERLDVPNPNDPVVGSLRITGTEGPSLYRILAEIEITPGDELRTKALGSLGAELHLNDGDVDGNMVIPDDANVVMDWDPTAGNGVGAWIFGGSGKAKNFEFSNANVYGKLYKYTEANYLNPGKEVITRKILKMPKWNLDHFLQPGPSRTHFDRISVLADMIIEDTVVVTLDPGATLVLDDVQLKGGLVVYVESTWDLRQGYRNEIIFRDQVIIGNGNKGDHPKLGLVAPACKVSSVAGGLGQELYGFHFVNEMDTYSMLKVVGQLIVVNDLLNFDHVDVDYDPEVSDDPPDGFEYGGPLPGVDVLLIRESYDAYEIPDYN